MNQYAVDVDNISKDLDGQTVLQDVTLHVKPGSVIGITGHNGSGKSMLLRSITGLVRPDSGTIRVFGQTIGEDIEFAPRTGALIDDPGFLPQYSGRKNLQLLASIQNRVDDRQIAETIRRVGLDPESNQPVRAYSTGMRQRLGIAQAIMENPELLILDEPTRGIDVNGLEQVYTLIRDLAASDVTILLTSHHADELSDLCETVYQMNRGQLNFADDPAFLSA